MGRARDARQRPGGRVVGPDGRRLRLVHALHRGVPDRRARRARHARLDPLPVLLDAGAGVRAGAVPRRARRARLRLRHLPGRLPLEPRRREAPRRRAAAPRRPSPRSRSWTGSRRTGTTWSNGTTVSTSPGTIRAGSAGTRSSRPATSAAPPSARRWSGMRTATTRCSASTPRGRSRGSTSGARWQPNRREPSVKLIRTLSVVRVAFVPLTLVMLLLDRGDFPPGYEAAAWSLLAVQALVALALLVLAWTLAGPPSAARGAERRRRLRPRRRAAARLRVGSWSAASHPALPRRARGGALLPPGRRHGRRGADVAAHRHGRAVPRVRVRHTGRGRLDRAPMADRARARRHRRTSRRDGTRPGSRRPRACHRSGAATRRARAADRHAGSDEPGGPRARLLARPGRGLRGLRPGAARAAAVRPRRHPPRRGKPRRRDGDGRNRRGGVSRPRHVRSRRRRRSSSW